MKLKPGLHQKHYLTALKQKNSMFEILFWMLGLGALALMEPDGKHLFSLCPFSWVWEKGCWGCGLGHGITYLFRGEWQASWEAHPLALPAVVILLWRSGQLLLWPYQQPETKNLI